MPVNTVGISQVVKASSEKDSSTTITKAVEPSNSPLPTKRKPHQPLSVKTSYEMNIRDNAYKMDTNLKGIEPRRDQPYVKKQF
jgi:hypothetical protein